MPGSSQQTVHDAMAIWQAGLEAVDGERLLQRQVSVGKDEIHFPGQRITLPEDGRICVVGAGKAAASMAVGLEKALGDELLSSRLITSWINVPEPCVVPTKYIHLHPARPAGRNEPTAAVIEGTRRILDAVAQLRRQDLCIVLLSGGGAPLAAPSAGISLEDKLQVTRLLVDRGADIHQLNAVRSCLSRVKAGRLAAACTAGTTVSLIISDVLGDPLGVIASGPTVPAPRTSGLAVARALLADDQDLNPAVWRALESAEQEVPVAPVGHVHNLILANLQLALDACAQEAHRRAYRVHVDPIESQQPTARETGTALAQRARHMCTLEGRRCLLSGGEPTVVLARRDIRGKGGRNQQLVLAALDDLANSESLPSGAALAFLSGGTDGEDGPTDAAGGIFDADTLAAVSRSRMNLRDFLDRNDAYHILGPLGCLIRTGPTHTNVCDIRVVLTENRYAAPTQPD